MEIQKVIDRQNNNGHKEIKPALINRRWLNSVVRRAFIKALTPKLVELKVNRLRVVYKPSFLDIATKTLKDNFHLGRRVW